MRQIEVVANAHLLLVHSTVPFKSLWDQNTILAPLVLLVSLRTCVRGCSIAWLGLRLFWCRLRPGTLPCQAPRCWQQVEDNLGAGVQLQHCDVKRKLALLVDFQVRLALVKCPHPQLAVRPHNCSHVWPYEP